MDNPPFTLMGTRLLPRMGMVETIALTLRKTRIKASICSVVICGISQVLQPLTFDLQCPYFFLGPYFIYIGME